MAESLCDTCKKPGNCCNGFQMNIREVRPEHWKDDAEDEMLVFGLPFTPIKYIPRTETSHGFGQVVFNCPKLGEDGRCTVYENRPQLCRDFEPKSDPICVYWDGTSEARATWR